MGRIWMPGGAGGADLDVVTAAAGDVLQGKVIVGPDGEPLTGTLALTGNAADSQVLAGKTYYNTDAKARRTGTMPNQGAVAPSGLNAGGSYTIPAGYHNGSGKVTANSLASQTGVQSGKTAAGAGQVLTGYEAWVNGGRVTGTMPNQGVQTAGVNCGGTYTIPAGYHNGQGKVTGNSLASQTDATSGAGDILSGKTAWVKGSKLTGTMANKGAVTGSVSCGGSYTIPAGYHNGSGKVTGNSLASQTGVQSGKTAAGAGQVLTGYEAWVNGNRTKTSSLNCGGSYTIPAGYHNGSGKVTANSLASQTSADAGAGHILSGKTAWVNGSKVTGTMTNRATVDSTIGGISSSYPTIAIHKGSNTQFNNSAKSGERLFAMAPPSGYYSGGSGPYVGCPAQSKTVTPGASTQTVYPDSGKVLETVTVNGVSVFKTYTGSKNSGNAAVDLRDDFGTEVKACCAISIPVAKNFVPMGVACFTNKKETYEIITQDPWHIIMMHSNGQYTRFFNYDSKNMYVAWANHTGNIVLPVTYMNTQYDYVLTGYLK